MGKEEVVADSTVKSPKAEEPKPEVQGPTQIEQEEQRAMQEAILWVVERTEKQSCPFCAWIPAIDAGNKKSKVAWLEGHLRETHPWATMEAFRQQTLQPALKRQEEVEDVFEAAGLTEVEQVDRFNALYVPKEVRENAEREGATLRWTPATRTRQYLDAGADTVDLGSIDKSEMPRQESSEDSTVRANEMVLVRIPPELAAKRRAAKNARTEKGLAARAEELHRNREGAARTVYDQMVRSGYDRQQASNVSNAIERGALDRGESPGAAGITIESRGQARKL